MVDPIIAVSDWSWEQVESSLLPVKGGIIEKAACYGYHFFKFLLCLPIAIASSSLAGVISYILPRKNTDTPLVAFAKRPEWGPEVQRAPVDIGFATADFQDNGPQAHPHTNWGDFYRRNAQNLGPLDHMPDVWNRPERVIDRLNALGVKKFRFSISRDKIEPRQGEPIDQIALQHYRNFCRSLRQNGIEPMVTLDHFSTPDTFSWERAEDIDGFVRYAESISDALYEEGVRKIVTINEPTVVAFQGWVMGEFPPHKTLDFEGAGRVLEHMMRAHTKVYEKLKARHPDFEIGLTHDSIRFRNFHKNHPIWSLPERLICHYLTEINHTAILRFFQTGKFSLKVPFFANYTFELPQKPPLDFIGLQYYTDPLLKFSLSGGESVTREPEERLATYQYRTYPQGLASLLEEFKTLGVPIDLTEIGIDTGINTDSTDRERIRYFDRVFQVVQKALENGIPVRSLYFWTLIDNLEWYKAFAIRFGFYSFNPTTGEIAPRPASQWLARQIAGRNRAARAG